MTFAVDGRERKVESSGSGPVDAAFKAIESIADSRAENCCCISVNAITTGTDAQGEVTVRLARDGKVVNGQGPTPTSSSPGQGLPQRPSTSSRRAPKAESAG